jgi:hypothetical protein
MKTFKIVFGFILMAGLTVLLSVPALELKSEFLGPMISSCPVAVSEFIGLFKNPLQADGQTVQSIWNCGIGLTLYLVVPGFGISWVITKHLLE